MCKQCMETGMVKVGSGHFERGNIGAEIQVSEACTCSAGKSIQQQERRTGFPDAVLLEVAERERNERMAAANRVMCPSQFCGTWLQPGQRGLCETCDREAYWS